MQAKKKQPKKRFRPSGAKTSRYVLQYHTFSADVFTTLRGLAGRKWSHDNPEGTEAGFKAYFEGLSDMQRQVMWTCSQH